MISFKKMIVICSLFICIVGACGIYIFSQHQQTSTKRQEDQSSTTIEQFHSSVDKDGDGIDDQQDMLDGALDYIATKPKYKSKYYSTGYPDDEYGVCTDVVAFAMKAAGYDLMQMVNEDVTENPEEYDISEPDINIDFRRVKNLRVYFPRHAVSLTKDISKVDEWQGGDIVVFSNHVGIVSDRRTKEGVPYVIHHVSPSQKNYEEDLLNMRNDIKGHFRISE